MSKLGLPDVTVVTIDCVAHKLAAKALQDTLARIQPAEVLVWSNKKLGPWRTFSFPNKTYTSKQYQEVLWYKVPGVVKTSHILTVQWDGWVTNAGAWDCNWLNYDYIGAPWWFNNGPNVGNGGFSLRSVKLMQYLANHPLEYPLMGIEDDLLCRTYRPLLEAEGFKWAPEDVAYRFSRECTGWGLIGPCFGFHGVFNFSKVLTPEEIEERQKLVSKYHYRPFHRA